MLQAGISCERMRIERIWTATRWDTVWKNLWVTSAPESIKARWYRAIHDILPTNARLHAIRISSTDSCSRCQGTDTILSPNNGMRGRTPAMDMDQKAYRIHVRTDQSRIPDDWLLRPDFTLWPSKRHKAVLWLVAHYVSFRTGQDRGLTTLDYFDFLRRSRWKLYRGGNVLITWKTTYVH